MSGRVNGVGPKVRVDSPSLDTPLGTPRGNERTERTERAAKNFFPPVPSAMNHPWKKEVDGFFDHLGIDPDAARM